MEDAKTSTTLYGKLALVQQALKVKKGNYNEFGKFYYRSCEDILESVKPLLGEWELVLKLEDEIVAMGDRFYIKATAKLIDTISGAETSSTAYAREAAQKKGMDESQVTGCASSYARKYALNGLFCIDDTKDADTMDNRDQGSNSRGNTNNRGNANNGGNRELGGSVTARMAAELQGLAKLKGASIQNLLTHYQIAKIEDLSVEIYNKVFQSWANKPDAQGAAG